MADTKISALTDGTTAEGTDRIAVARDPTGTPLSRYITPAYVAEYMRTLTQTLTNKTLTTPVLGVATATSINKVAFTAPATSATLTLSNGSSLITSGGHSLTFTTTGSTNVTLPTTGTVLTTATGASLGANTFTALQTITQASANTGIIASTGYSLTGSDATSMVSLAGTWNTTGTPTALLLNITDTASNAASKLVDLQTGGTTRFNVSRLGVGTLSGELYVGTGGTTGGGSPALRLAAGADGLRVTRGDSAATGFAMYGLKFGASSGGTIGFLSGDLTSTTFDTVLARHAANVLAQRNSTTAQAHKWNYSYTNDSNESYAYVDLNTANTLTFGSNGIGTGAGVVTKFRLLVDGTNRLDYGVTTASTLTSAGPIAITSGTLTLGDWNSFFRWSGGTRISTNGTDGHILMTTSAGTGFDRLMFGGNTSSFPALKRSTTDLQVRLADDSGYAGLQLGTASSALKVGTHSAIAAETVTGYITIKDSAGTDRKIAVVS